MVSAALALVLFIARLVRAPARPRVRGDERHRCRQRERPAEGDRTPEEKERAPFFFTLSRNAGRLENEREKKNGKLSFSTKKITPLTLQKKKTKPLLFHLSLSFSLPACHSFDICYFLRLLLLL